MYIRTRLTLLFLLILAALLGTVAWSVRTLTFNSLLGEIDRDVHQMVQAMAAALPAGGGPPHLANLDAFAGPDTQAALFGADGTLLASAGYLSKSPIPLQRPALGA